MIQDQYTKENIILLDDPDLFREVTEWLGKSKPDALSGLTLKILSSGGTGFTQSRRFEIDDTVFNFLLISPENAHPFTYLSLGQRALRRCVPLVVAVTQARNLRQDLYPGDIALVSEAAGLPYPALFQNRDPLEPTESATEVYAGSPETISSFKNLMEEVTLPHIWQDGLFVVRSGYAKHPTRAGGLAPWAPEQFEKLKEAGVDTIAETPSGVYEFQQLSPTTSVICFNMIKGPAPPQEDGEWKRHKTKLLYPAIRLITDILKSHKTVATDTLA